MADFKTKFGTGRQDWETPATVFDPLNAEFRFTLDVCATAENAKCQRYYTAEDDALSKPWEGVCWMNPPFGTQGAWVRKAYEESQRNGTTVVCLLPARTNTNWWHSYCMKGEIRFIKGRPKFKGAEHGLPQPLAIVVFRAAHVLPSNTETQSPHPVGSSAWLGRKIQYVIQTHIGSDVWSDWAFKDQALEVERRIESLKTERPHRTFRGVMRTITDEPLRPNGLHKRRGPETLNDQKP